MMEQSMSSTISLSFITICTTRFQMREKVNITCPNCKKIVEIDSRFKPFCSKACKSIDFLRWANEEVAIETFDQQAEEKDDY